jgi:hypothetical protein
MDREFFHQLTSRESLLGIGSTLIVIGIVFRSFARSNRRALALRKQDALRLRKLDEAGRAGCSELETTHWERHLPRYATGFIVAGLAVLAVSFLR